jgi:protein gp37
MDCVDVTDNIIVGVEGGWWCQKISAGCTHCYAEQINQNPFFGGNQQPYVGPAPELMLKRDCLASWKRQLKKKRHLVASMTDVFGEWVPREWQLEMFDAMLAAPKQIFMLLTKRPHIMQEACQDWLGIRFLDQLPDNIWLGCTIENQSVVRARLSTLTQIPTSKRWIVCEPLLGPIQDLGDFLSAIDFVMIGGELVTRLGFAIPIGLEQSFMIVNALHLLPMSLLNN